MVWSLNFGHPPLQYLAAIGPVGGDVVVLADHQHLPIQYLAAIGPVGGATMFQLTTNPFLSNTWLPLVPLVELHCYSWPPTPSYPIPGCHWSRWWRCRCSCRPPTRFRPSLPEPSSCIQEGYCGYGLFFRLKLFFPLEYCAVSVLIHSV